MKKHIRLYGTAALLLVLSLLTITGAAQAAYPARVAQPPGPAGRPAVPVTHGRLSQLNWQVTGGNTVQFRATAGIRRSFYVPQPNVGDVVAYSFIEYGDGGRSATNSFTVTFVDLAHDWIIAEKEDTYTYSGSGPWTANFNNCCRLSPPQHINNPDQGFRAETIVNTTATTANPVSSLPAIVDCPQAGICNFTVPAFDPDGQPMRFRMANASEGGDGGFHQPGPPEAPNSAVINPTTGAYTWDTHGATLNAGGDTFYSTQVIVENLNTQNQVITKTPVDFFIRLIPQTNTPPRFIPPTPPDGTIFTIAVGNPIAVPVVADDPDVTDNVTLAVINLPNGAAFPIPPPANPAGSMLTWTPTVADVGAHVINFTATDTQGTSVFTSITINVLVNTPTVTRTPPPKNTTTPTPTLPAPPATATATLPVPPPTSTCVPQTPTRVPTPPYTPAPGCSSNPGSRVDGEITTHPTTTDATFNNRSSTCSYRIGLATYRKFDNNIDHQELYDYTLAVIPPNSSLTLTVNNPPCAYQADAFWGDILYSLAGGVRYGSRLLDDYHGNGTNWCVPVCETNTGTVKPKTKSPGLSPGGNN